MHWQGFQVARSAYQLICPAGAQRVYPQRRHIYEYKYANRSTSRQEVSSVSGKNNILNLEQVMKGKVELQSDLSHPN